MDEFLRLCTQLPAPPQASPRLTVSRPSCVQNPNTGCAVKGLPGHSQNLSTQEPLQRLRSRPQHQPAKARPPDTLAGQAGETGSIAVRIELWAPPTRELALP